MALTIRSGEAYNKDEILPKIYANLELGMPIKYACHDVGISEDALLVWRHQDPSIHEQMLAANARFIKRSFGNIQLYGHKTKNWTAFAWMVERTHREFAQTVKQEVTHQTAFKGFSDADLKHVIDITPTEDPVQKRIEPPIGQIGREQKDEQS